MAYGLHHGQLHLAHRKSTRAVTTIFNWRRRAIVATRIVALVGVPIALVEGGNGVAAAPWKSRSRLGLAQVSHEQYQHDIFCWRLA